MQRNKFSGSDHELGKGAKSKKNPYIVKVRWIMCECGMFTKHYLLYSHIILRSKYLYYKHMHQYEI